LLLNENYLKKTTAVISIASLQETGAMITTGLSQDYLIEGLIKEMVYGRSSNSIGRCNRVHVLFPGYGVGSFAREKMSDLFRDPDPLWDIYSEKVKFEGFIYDPMNSDSKWKKSFPGHFNISGCSAWFFVIRFFSSIRCPCFGSNEI